MEILMEESNVQRVDAPVTVLSLLSPDAPLVASARSLARSSVCAWAACAATRRFVVIFTVSSMISWSSSKSVSLLHREPFLLLPFPSLFDGCFVCCFSSKGYYHRWRVSRHQLSVPGRFRRSWLLLGRDFPSSPRS